MIVVHSFSESGTKKNEPSPSIHTLEKHIDTHTHTGLHKTGTRTRTKTGSRTETHRNSERHALASTGVREAPCSVACVWREACHELWNLMRSFAREDPAAGACSLRAFWGARPNLKPWQRPANHFVCGSAPLCVQISFGTVQGRRVRDCLLAAGSLACRELSLETKWQ